MMNHINHSIIFYYISIISVSTVMLCGCKAITDASQSQPPEKSQKSDLQENPEPQPSDNIEKQSETNIQIPATSLKSGAMTAECHGSDVDISSIKDVFSQYRCDSIAPMFVCNKASGCTCGSTQCGFGAECADGKCWCQGNVVDNTDWCSHNSSNIYSDRRILVKEYRVDENDQPYAVLETTKQNGEIVVTRKEYLYDIDVDWAYSPCGFSEYKLGKYGEPLSKKEDGTYEPCADPDEYLIYTYKFDESARGELSIVYLFVEGTCHEVYRYEACLKHSGCRKDDKHCGYWDEAYYCNQVVTGYPNSHFDTLTKEGEAVYVCNDIMPMLTTAPEAGKENGPYVCAQHECKCGTNQCARGDLCQDGQCSPYQGCTKDSPGAKPYYYCHSNNDRPHLKPDADGYECLRFDKGEIIQEPDKQEQYDGNYAPFKDDPMADFKNAKPKNWHCMKESCACGTESCMTSEVCEDGHCICDGKPLTDGYICDGYRQRCVKAPCLCGGEVLRPGYICEYDTNGESRQLCVKAPCVCGGEVLRPGYTCEYGTNGEFQKCNDEPCQCGKSAIESGYCKNDKHLTIIEVDKINAKSYCIKHDTKTGEISKASCFENAIANTHFYLAECLDGRKFKFYREMDSIHDYPYGLDFDACELCPGNPPPEMMNPYCYIGEDIEEVCGDTNFLDTEGKWQPEDKR